MNSVYTVYCHYVDLDITIPNLNFYCLFLYRLHDMMLFDDFDSSLIITNSNRIFILRWYNIYAVIRLSCGDVCPIDTIGVRIIRCWWWRQQQWIHRPYPSDSYTTSHTTIITILHWLIINIFTILTLSVWRLHGWFYSIRHGFTGDK